LNGCETDAGAARVTIFEGIFSAARSVWPTGRCGGGGFSSRVADLSSWGTLRSSRVAPPLPLPFGYLILLNSLYLAARWMIAENDSRTLPTGNRGRPGQPFASPISGANTSQVLVLSPCSMFAMNPQISFGIQDRSEVFAIRPSMWSSLRTRDLHVHVKETQRSHFRRI